MSEMCGWLVGLPAPAPACMCGVEGSRPQPLTQASALKETESGEARAALTIVYSPGQKVRVTSSQKPWLVDISAPRARRPSALVHSRI